MSAYVYTISTFILILVLSAAPLRAQDHTTQSRGYPKLEQAVEITDMQLLGVATRGATVELQVRFRAHVDGPGSIMLRYPKHVAPPGRQPGEKSRTYSLTLKDGEQYVKTYPMRVEDTGGAMVSAIVRAENVPDGYDTSDSEHINVVTGADTYRVFAPGDTTRQRVTATKGTAEKAQAKAQSFYTVSVSGEVKYLDENESPDRMEGLYGSEVELWFRDSSNPDQLYHPVLGDVEHTHYDEVEEDGQYHFDFSFSGDLSGYDELLVLVATSNDAATTSVGQGAWIIDSGSGTESFFGGSQGVVYDISGMGTSISISNAGAEVNSEDGAILRSMMLAREFVTERYNGNSPFNLPIISVWKEPLDDNAGLFCEPEDGCGSSAFPVIIIDPSSTDFTSTTHEYGHYLNYRMWGGGDGPLNKATSQLKEGWAIFYSFAARNYANEAYGDALLHYDDNTEEDAFDETPYRFQGIRYADVGKPSFAAFACYLWSLYDNYSGGPFEVALYDSGDNDDVSGYTNRVFEVFRTEQETTASGYNTAFKNGLSSETQASTQSIYDFMTSDLTNVPSTPMRPPQLTNASGQIKTNGDVDFQWAEQSYPTGRDYGNYPDGYRLDKDGQTVATASFGTTSYTYAPSGTNSGNYQLTAYNVDGEAQFAPTLDLGIDVTISGPSSVSSGEQGTWTANVSGGTGTLSYQWYEKYDTDPSFSLISGATSASYSSVYFNNILLKAEVTAHNGSDAQTKYVTVGSEGTNQIVVEDRLAHFGGKATGDGTAILTWETSRSTSMDTPFAVQRTLGSTGETTWRTIGTVEARSSAATYRFTDRTFPYAADTLHYRLRLVGSEGAASASDPIAVVRENVSAVQLKETYPNPAAEQVTVRYAVPEDATGDVRLTLYDAMGRAVRTVQAGPVQGRHRVQLDVGGLSSGVYLLRLRAGGTVKSRRLTVVR